MRLPQGHSIAIFGLSGSGKSTVARLLAKELKIPLRECGDFVREVANKKKVAISDVSEDDHRQIDQETCHWVSEMQGCVVEGRFLDAVLRSIPDQVTVVRLDASADARASRLSKRSGRDVSAADVRAMDDEDGNFRQKMYKECLPLAPHIALDTSGYGPDECLSILMTQLFPVPRG